jgi:hypothetical protein
MDLTGVLNDHLNKWENQDSCAKAASDSESIHVIRIKKPMKSSSTPAMKYSTSISNHSNTKKSSAKEDLYVISKSQAKSKSSRSSKNQKKLLPRLAHQQINSSTNINRNLAGRDKLRCDHCDYSVFSKNKMYWHLYEKHGINPTMLY